MNYETSAAVSELYRQINTQVASFQSASGLHCPPGCGQCCENPEVEASPLEMLPMATEMIRRGEVEMWLTRLSETSRSGTCVCYQPDAHIPGNGRCQMYLWRPTLCRLFGFAAVTDKSGTPTLAACIKHKQLFGDGVAMAQVAIANGLAVPHFADWQTQVANLDPHWGHQRMPINQALGVALEVMSFYLSYAMQNPANATEGAELPDPQESQAEQFPSV